VTVRRAALAAALLSIALPRFGGDALAADARLRVLIVVDASDDPFAERIKAEVSSLGRCSFSTIPTRGRVRATAFAR